MADKMIRVAHRDKNGLAKPLQFEEVILDEVFSSQGREIAAGGTWESPIFETGGLSKLSYYTSLSQATNHSIKVVQGIEKNGTFFGRDTQIIAPEGATENINGCIDIYSPVFKIVVENFAQRPFSIGFYLYLKS